MTPQDRKLLDEQKCCQICKKTTDLVVDHDHVTNKVRGYLCTNHNKGIGMFNDSIEELKAAINYLSTNV
jgi:queuine/archaeosine tRNA-ribosyltransferase